MPAPVSLSLALFTVPVPSTVCLFAAALANPNRGWSVFALNLPLRETGPLESNKTRNRARIRVIFSLAVVPLRRAKIVIPIDICRSVESFISISWLPSGAG